MHGFWVGPDAADLQIPKVRKLAREIEDLFMISHRKHQPQGLQGPQKRPEIFLHLWNERRDIQSMNHEAPEVREGAEVLDVGIQIVCGERSTPRGKGDRDVTGVLEETAFI